MVKLLKKIFIIIIIAICPFTVNAKEEKSGNCYISDINSDIIKLNFKKDKFKYNVTVDNSIKKLDLDIILEDEKATSSISSQNLAIGKNTINIVTTAENGDKLTYIIEVTRKAKPVSQGIEEEPRDFSQLIWLIITLLVGGVLYIILDHSKINNNKGVKNGRN